MSEELFDIVDDLGNPTGRTATRSLAHAEGLRHRTAHIWVVRHTPQGPEVLLQKRSDNKDSFPGQWDTSSAGHIHAGDEVLPSALRELEEELGITARPEDLKPAGTFEIQYDRVFHGKVFRDNEISFVFVYDLPVDLSALRLQEEEVSEVRFFPIDWVKNACQHRDGTVCVPTGGLETVCRWLDTHPNG